MVSELSSFDAAKTRKDHRPYLTERVVLIDLVSISICHSYLDQNHEAQSLGSVVQLLRSPPPRLLHSLKYLDD